MVTYQQTIDYLYSKLPMFTRIGAAALKKDLHNTRAMLEVLDNPHQKFKSIHIAGTNGKGSTSHMLAAILQNAGYKTGLYTSPHLKDFRERIRLNGKMVPKSFVVDFTKHLQSAINDIEPSFFEVTVAMAFDFFAKEKVDVAVIEVGLGGRLDSTNVINPNLSVITNISFDHTDLLGNTLPEIAFEKAGIIKHKVPVVIGETHPETSAVFLKKAATGNSNIVFADQNLTARNIITKGNHLIVDIFENDHCIFNKLVLDLNGIYQLKNVTTVIQSVLQLRKTGYQISNEAVREGLKNVKLITGIQGRWQTLGVNPLIVCDTGHNKSGIAEVLININNASFDHLHIVLGMVADKDISAIINLMPKKASYYFCQPKLERALPTVKLMEQATEHKLQGNAYNSVIEALNAAKNAAKTNDLIFVGGSTFVVAEVV